MDIAPAQRLAPQQLCGLGTAALLASTIALIVPGATLAVLTLTNLLRIPDDFLAGAIGFLIPLLVAMRIVYVTIPRSCLARGIGQNQSRMVGRFQTMAIIVGLPVGMLTGPLTTGVFTWPLGGWPTWLATLIGLCGFGLGYIVGSGLVCFCAALIAWRVAERA